MGNPVTPDAFKQLLPAASGTACDSLVKSAIGFQATFYQYYQWMWNPDGTPSAAFLASLGQASAGGLQAPTNLAASSLSTTIALTWNAVATATSYDVYRATAPNPPTVGVTTPYFAGISATNLTDTPTVGITYYYWVVAKNPSGVSGLSNMVSGAAGTGADTQTFTPGAVVQNVTVPATKTTATVTLYGGGAGGGGGGGSPFGSASQATGGGGGGGAAEKRVITIGSLTGGVSILNLWPGKGGLGGAPTNSSGSLPPTAGLLGDQSWVSLSPDPTHLCAANGGGPGGPGNVLVAGSAGAAGTGGTGGAATPGAPGAAGTLALPSAGGGVGGAGGTATDGYGGGGAGGGFGQPGVKGGDGFIKIVFT